MNFITRDEIMNEIKIIPTGNEELDIKLGGGIPHPSLIVVEGDHGSGKTAIALQVLKGFLLKELRSVVITSESSPREFLVKARASGFDLEDPYIKGLFRIYTMRYPGELSPLVGELIAKRLSKFFSTQHNLDFVMVDSISYLSSVNASVLYETIVSIKRFTERGGSALITLHPNTLHEELVTKLKNMADGILRTSVAVVGGKSVKVLSIIKLRGAPPGVESSITFDVDPAFGIKLIPITVSHA
jgi:flagellar protein FlaH